MEVVNWSDLDGDVVLSDGRRVSKNTGKAYRRVRRPHGYNCAVHSFDDWDDAPISAEELAELSALYVAHLEDEAAKKQAAEEARLKARAAEEASPEYQARRREAIASVRRFFTAKQIPDEMVPDFIDMSYDKDDISINVWGE